MVKGGTYSFTVNMAMILPLQHVRIVNLKQTKIKKYMYLQRTFDLMMYFKDIDYLVIYKLGMYLKLAVMITTYNHQNAIID